VALMRSHTGSSKGFVARSQRAANKNLRIDFLISPKLGSIAWVLIIPIILRKV